MEAILMVDRIEGALEFADDRLPDQPRAEPLLRWRRDLAPAFLPPVQRQRVSGYGPTNPDAPVFPLQRTVLCRVRAHLVERHAERDRHLAAHGDRWAVERHAMRLEWLQFRLQQLMQADPRPCCLGEEVMRRGK